MFMELLFSGVLSLLVFAIGACIGSFLNVVIYRIPAGVSLLHPPSRCPRCLHRLKPYDNVPILGWLWLQGKCRHCRTKISPRYPAIEAATGILFVLVFWAFSLPLPGLGYWAFVSWLLALSLIDWDTLTLPNSLTQSGLIAGLVFQIIVGWTTAGLSGAASSLMMGILGAVAAIWVFDAVTILGSIAFGKTAMGGGDAKLAAMMGAWLGWKLTLLAGFLACVIGAFLGGGAMALGVIDRRQPLPFGPFLAIGAGIALFFGDAMMAGYLRLFFPTL
jgi:leader peptidase (prepilin peptidase)/N-methyltransferase